ncbi:MAG TPA: 3D domain-containing protein [Gemmatimonadaceae bacterium]|jgi:3D (Asp-Asp-Asp) domain-containing protein
MKKSRISRETRAVGFANGGKTIRSGETLRAFLAVTVALALIGTGAVALPSLAPAPGTSEAEVAPATLPQLEPMQLAAIEDIHENAAMLAEPIKAGAKAVARALPTAAAKVARVTTKATKPIADGVASIPGSVARATAHEAIKMKRGIIPLIPSKFARAQDGITIPVSLTQYCVQGETRRGRQTRHGIVAADPRIFPLARYVEVFLGNEYLGRYLVDDTGGNVLGATLDIWNPDCKEAARFGRHWGSAILVAREVESVPNDTLVPTRWDGLAKR